MQKSVLLGAIQSHFIRAAPSLVNKFDFNFLAYTLQVAVTPDLKRISFGLPTAFFFRTLVRSTHGMGINRSGRSIHDINSSAISFPTWYARGKVFIGVSNAPIVFFLVLVFRRVGSRITTLPEGFNKLVSLRVGRQLFEGGELFICDDPADV